MRTSYLLSTFNCLAHVQCALLCLSQPIAIGDDCVLGERSALMGLSTMKSGSVLAPMAQGAKGMTFEARKIYVGNPADVRAV